MLPFSMLFFSAMAVGNTAELQSFTYNNGVKLVVEEDHSAPVAMVQIWLKVGGRDEVPGKTGLAHVFEHMMFKGSKKLAPGEFSKRISAIGGNDNAFTSTDYTAYFETVPASAVDDVLGMEAERFANLRLRDEDFQKEIKVIMEERRMRTDDDPNSHMFEELSAAALRLHPYRNPVIGWMQDLQRLSIEDVRAFYNKHYVAGNVTVVVVGDVDFKHLQNSVKKTFGHMKARPVTERFNPIEPPPLGAKRIEVSLPAKLPLLAMVVPVPVWQPGQNDHEAAGLALATFLLGGGRTALVQQDLVDKQRLAFSASVGYDPFGMGLDLWYAYAMLGPSQTPKAFEDGFWKLIETLSLSPVSQQRLDIARKNMIAQEVFEQDSLYLRAKTIGRLETSGIGADHKDDWIKALQQATPDDVQQALKTWIRQDHSTTGLLKPEKTS
ncbi:MAG: peptidase M16 [Zetaproteobacteria bacterium CG_4_9_14_3_um_filter_49_83]|nr:MAG: peptidase M16 [Zetaproteobacteria bacterium CG1_02_49_23]PIQ34952.1 MAG: peptidase M16 [Zetaproteobacteria bacterium CG17_big_fil_post_rev_8_21_14_2_50_50_13]PIV31465.1 MAG: peptidase M16 [Zetaproteobacteria bacterium CG02_land_8_20_14_3_00_50_9]PIY55048.1 MAG: peptidase M16 [Zetaproteobacteria bacterium CG_4_10_14_0_8_um_filter_49_80]PJA36535.1 MAG: peptidase M16 [Zetaproteobacteria bacterium CG_4_9_14_3_um_filter_49_83]